MLLAFSKHKKCLALDWRKSKITYTAEQEQLVNDNWGQNIYSTYFVFESNQMLQEDSVFCGTE